MSLLSAYVGTAGLADMGYQFRNIDETANGSRITAGIVDAGDGWYSVNATIPSNATSVRWDSTGTAAAKAREYFYSYGANLGSSGVDAIWAKTMTELSAVPGVTADVLSAVQWVFLLARNKLTQTSTTQTLRNNADAATIGTSTVNDDGTTFTRGKFS